MSKTKVTVVNQKNLPEFSKGKVLRCQKDPSNEYDSYAIKVFDGGDQIGYISNGAKTTVGGTMNNKAIYDYVDNNFEIVVEKMDSVVSRGTKKTVVVATVELEDSGAASSSGVDTITAKVKIKGSSIKNPKKKEVISLWSSANEEHDKELAAGNRKHKLESILLTAKLDTSVLEHPITVYYNDEPAGYVDEKCSSVGYANATTIGDIKMALEEAGELECLVVGRPEISQYSVEFSIAKAAMEEASTKASKKVVETIKSDLEAKGFEADVLSNIEDVLLNAGLSANQVKAWFETFEIYPDDEKALIPTWEEVRKYVDNQNHLKLAVGAILKGKHLNLLGEKGTGKNTFADYILYLAQRPKHELSGNGQTSKAEFFGEPTINSELTDAGEVAHKIEFDPEQFVQAMGYKEDDPKRHAGGCALIDEANGIPADVLLSLNSSADARKAVTVPGYGRVNAGKNFFIMLTMNIGYEGTRSLNEAFKDRFVPIRFDSLDSIEQILLSNCPTAKKVDIQKANKIYQRMISLVHNNDGELDSSCITIRGFIDALDLVEFVGLKEALIVNVADRILDDDEYRRKAIDIIETIIG